MLPCVARARGASAATEFSRLLAAFPLGGAIRALDWFCGFLCTGSVGGSWPRQPRGAGGSMAGREILPF